MPHAEPWEMAPIACQMATGGLIGIVLLTKRLSRDRRSPFTPNVSGPGSGSVCRANPGDWHEGLVRCLVTIVPGTSSRMCATLRHYRAKTTVGAC